MTFQMHKLCCRGQESQCKGYTISVLIFVNGNFVTVQADLLL